MVQAKKETVRSGIISNSDMKFVKAMKKNGLPMDLLNLSSCFEPYVF
jgi:hypothetical protein